MKTYYDTFLLFGWCFFLGPLSCTDSNEIENTENNNTTEEDINVACQSEDAVECHGNTVVICEDGEWHKVMNCEANNMICQKPFSGPAGCVPLRSIDKEDAETICSNFSEMIRDSLTDREICRASMILLVYKSPTKTNKENCEHFLEMCNDSDFVYSAPTEFMKEIDNQCPSTMDNFIHWNCIVTQEEAEQCANDLAAAFLENIMSAGCDNIIDPAVVAPPISCKTYEDRCS